MSTAHIQKMVADFPTMGGRVYRLLINRLPPRAIRSKLLFKVYSRVVDSIARDLAADAFGASDRKAFEMYLGSVSHFVSEYEAKAFPRDNPKPEELLEFLMEQHDLKQADLSDELGGQAVVSQILKGARKLNRGQIERLAKRFHVSPAIFFGAQV